MAKALKNFLVQRWLLLALALLVVGVRVLNWNQTPAGWYWDEVAIMVDAKSIVTTGQEWHGLSGLQAIYPSYGDYKLPVLVLATALFHGIGFSLDTAVRLPNLLAGLAAITACMWLATRIWPLKYTSLIALLVLGFSPAALHFSRIGFESGVGVSLVAIALCCWWYSLRTNSWKGLAGTFVTGLLGTLAVYSYYATQFVLPVALIGAAIAFYGENQKLKTFSYRLVLIKIILVLATVGVLLVPLWRSPFFANMTTIRLSTLSVLNDTQLPVTARQWQTVGEVTKLDRFFWHRYILFGKQFLENYTQHLSADFLFIHGDSNLRHGTGMFGVFAWWTAPFLLIGLGILAERKPLVLLWLTSWWAISLVPAAIPMGTPHLLRSLHSIVPITLIMSVGGVTFFEALRRRFKPHQFKLVLAGLLAIILFELAYFTWIYQLD